MRARDFIRCCKRPYWISVETAVTRSFSGVGEQHRITGALSQAGFEQEAHDFIVQEMQNPATADQLAAACQSQEQAVQVFTAARLAIDLDNNEENEFLADLATKLGIDGNLAQHVDAAAKAQAA